MKKMNAILRCTAIALCLLLCISSLTRAQTTVTIGGGASITCPAVPTATYTPAVSGVTFSNWSRGSGVTCASAGNGLSGSGFNTANYAASFAANKYYSITITAGAGTPFLLTQITWTTAVSSGTPNFTIQYSNNGGALTTFGTTAQTNQTLNTFTGSVSVTASTSIVLYFIPAGGSLAGTVRIVNGSTITVNTGAPASTDWFRSVQSGNWSSFTTWESSPDGTTWFSATQTPTNAAHSIEIQNGHTVNISSAQTAKLLTIDAGGILTHAAGFGLTITDDGTSATDFAINGRYELNGTMPTYSGTAEKVVVANGGEVRANDNTPPNSTSDDFARDVHVYFNTGSLFSWYYAGVSTFSTTGFTYFPNATATDKAIFRVCVNVAGTVGGGSTTVFNGKFEVASGVTVTFQNAGMKIFRDGLGGAGTLIHSNTCGRFQITSATAVIDGSVTVDIADSTAVGNNDLEIPSGANVTMSGTAKVNIGKTPNTSASMKVDGVFTTNGLLTFKSDANGTARVAQSTGTINGNVIVERFIPAKRAWRLLTHSLNLSSQSIKTAWQEGVTNDHTYGLWLLNPNPGYGMQITYRDSSDVSNGYDANLQRNPSMQVWSGTTWSVPSATTIPITTYSGYMAFVRGNRANLINLGTSAPTSTTTLRATGTINQGATVGVFTIVAGGQYTLIGNPYISTIDLTNVLSRNAAIIDATTFTIWDPGINPYGGYIQWLSGVSAPHSTNYPSDASPLTIQSGQAFFLKTISANPTVFFAEADKVASSSSSVFARPAQLTPPTIHIDLRNKDSELLDGVAIGFGSYAAVPRWTALYEGISLVSKGSKYAIEIRPAVERDTFYLEFSKLKQQTYHLRFEQDLQDLNMKVQLVDRFTDKHMPFGKGTQGYAFEVTADSASFKHRFMLITHMPRPQVPIPTPLVEVYPNPTKGEVRITRDGKLYTGPVRITDLSGRAIRTVLSQNGVINCSFLDGGVYFLVLKDGTVIRCSKL